MRNCSGLNRKKEQHWWFNNMKYMKYNAQTFKNILAMSQEKKKKTRNKKQMFCPAIILFAQCPTRTMCWNQRELYSICFYLDVLSFLGSVISCFTFLKGVVLRRHVLPSIILWIKWGQRQGSRERVSLRSSPMVAFVDWGNTNSKTGQSQRKLTCLILSLRGRRHYSFHLFPWAQIFGLHLTNKILSGPNSGLRLSLELGDADTQGGSGLVRRRRGVT